MLYTCVLLCDKLILWPEVQSDSDYSHVHATGPCSACALTQAHPTMSCIQLVLMETEWSNKTCCWEVSGPGPSSLPPWRHNFPYTSHGVYVARLSNVTSRHTSSTHTIMLILRLPFIQSHPKLCIPCTQKANKKSKKFPPKNKKACHTPLLKQQEIPLPSFGPISSLNSIF